MRQKPRQEGAALERIAILLATKNGEAFLDEQIRSLADQTHPAIDIWASDDGSTDGTLTILNDWQSRWEKGKFHIVEGPGRGFARNFRSLVLNEAIDADCMAFCDQDDVWQPEKLETALAWMRTEAAATPLLFCSRTLNISPEGRAIGMSPLFNREPSFRNALVQSLAGGNTMVLNRTAWRYLRLASRRTVFVSHDWWAYQLVTGVGGLVRYSREPLVHYRQHAGNLVGANRSWKARLARLKFLIGGGFRNWNDVNVPALERNRDMLTPDALLALRSFKNIRREGVFVRLGNFARSGVYRQTILGTLGIWLAAALGRF